MNNQDKLRQLRLTLGLSQRDLAQKIGVSANAVNNFEHGAYSQNGRSEVSNKIQSFIDNIDDNLPQPLYDVHAPSEKIAFSFSNGKRYYIFDSGNAKGEADYIRPETGKGCVFVYLRKEGKHHIFREQHGGWTRTYTDVQLMGKKIQEV